MSSKTKYVVFPIEVNEKNESLCSTDCPFKRRDTCLLVPVDQGFAPDNEIVELRRVNFCTQMTDVSDEIISHLTGK